MAIGVREGETVRMALNRVVSAGLPLGWGVVERSSGPMSCQLVLLTEDRAALAHRHGPTGRLAILAQRRGTVCASPTTWYGLVRRHRWRRPRVRVHPKASNVGVRASDELWRIDTTVVRLLDGSRTDLYAVIDNYSRRILSWRVADRSTSANSVAVLLAACGQAKSLDGVPVQPKEVSCGSADG